MLSKASGYSHVTKWLHVNTATRQHSKHLTDCIWIQGLSLEVLTMNHWPVLSTAALITC